MSAAGVGGEVRRLGHVPALDGIRAVAVLLVMCFHAGVPGFGGGKAGVDVFFVLSGFLITSLLLEERALTGAIRLPAFYMRRILRLYPALVVAVLGSIALAALKIPVFDASSSSFRSTLSAAPFALIYTMNVPRAAGLTGGGFLGHTWSLAIEEQFYLVWPLVVILATRGRATPVAVGWIAVGCALASTALRMGLDLAGYSSEMLYNATFSHVDGIFTGCVLAVLWIIRRELVARLGHPVLVAVALVASAVIIVRGENMNVYGFTIVVVTTAVVIAHTVSRPASLLSKALARPAAVEVGKRSYGLYLYHWPIFLFIGIDTRLPVLALGFAMTFAAAWVSFAVVERPFLRMKDRWGTKRALPCPQGPESIGSGQA